MQRRRGRRVEVSRRTGGNARIFHPANGIVRLSSRFRRRKIRPPEPDGRARSSNVRPSVTPCRLGPISGGAALLRRQKQVGAKSSAGRPRAAVRTAGLGLSGAALLLLLSGCSLEGFGKAFGNFGWPSNGISLQ